jgi:hypothetical protein
MTISVGSEILGRLEAADVTVSVDDGSLLIRPASKVPADLWPVLQAHKTEIIDLLESIPQSDAETATDETGPRDRDATPVVDIDRGQALLERLDRDGWHPHLDHEGELSLATHGGRPLPKGLALDVQEHRNDLMGALRERTERDVSLIHEIVAQGPIPVDVARRRFMGQVRSHARWCWALVHSDTPQTPGETPGESGSKADSWTLS